MGSSSSSSSSCSTDDQSHEQFTFRFTDCTCRCNAKKTCPTDSELPPAALLTALMSKINRAQYDLRELFLVNLIGILPGFISLECDCDCGEGVKMGFLFGNASS